MEGPGPGSHRACIASWVRARCSDPFLPRGHRIPAAPPALRGPGGQLWSLRGAHPCLWQHVELDPGNEEAVTLTAGQSEPRREGVARGQAAGQVLSSRTGANRQEAHLSPCPAREGPVSPQVGSGWVLGSWPAWQESLGLKGKEEEWECKEAGRGQGPWGQAPLCQLTTWHHGGCFTAPSSHLEGVAWQEGARPATAPSTLSLAGLFGSSGHSCELGWGPRCVRFIACPQG